MRQVSGCLRLVCAAGAVLLVMPVSSSAAVVSINDYLVNPSFEAAVGPGCPIGWTCGGSPSPSVEVFEPGAGNFNVGPIVPDGRNAAHIPVSPSGSGSLRQDVAGLSYMVGNTYELTFWLGNPLGQPSGAGFPTSLNVSFLLNGVKANLCDGWGVASLTSGALAVTDNSSDCVLGISGTGIPTAGQWREYTLSYTPKIQRVGNVGFLFDVTASQGQDVTFDFKGKQVQELTQVPEPGILSLLGLGLVGLASRVRSRAR